MAVISSRDLADAKAGYLAAIERHDPFVEVDTDKTSKMRT